MITTDIEKARQVLIRDEIIAIPTETVYGLAGNAYSEEAVKKIFQLKKRPLYNPLIIHIASGLLLDQVAYDIPEGAEKLAKTFWPGPLTLLLKKLPHIPDIVTAGSERVAIRVPDHPLTRKLLETLDFPLAAPSANPFGSISPTSARHVESYFPHDLEVILDGGDCEKGLESTIIGFEDGKPILYRYGSVSVEQIEEVVGKVTIHTRDDTKPSAPGMLSRHYAPSTSTYLSDDISGLLDTFTGKKIGVISFQNSLNDARIFSEEVIAPSGKYEEAARNLYSALHRLDRLNLDVIIAERLPNHGLGKTINDRLERATKK